MSFSILDVWRPTYFDNILTKIGALPILYTTSSVKSPYDLTRHHYFNIKEKVGVLSPVGDFLTTNLSMFFECSQLISKHNEWWLDDNQML